MNTTSTFGRPYSRDVALLRKLGLPLWESNNGEETLIGEVMPFPAHEEEQGRTKVQIFVNSMPAQVYRFVIERRSEAEGYDGMERVEVTTGSGSLSEFWPMVLAVAGGRLDVSQAQLLSVN